MKDKETQLYVTLTVISLLLLILVLGRVQAGPPSQVTFAAGSRTGAYYKFALQYKERLAANGLEVVVLETGGSLENLRLLREGKADIAFIQSGLSPDGSQLQSLGSVFPEPLWLFTRGEEPLTRMNQLLGKSVAIGTTDSGTREVALSILDDAKMREKLRTVSVGGEEAKQQLLNGELDAAFFVGAQSVQAVKELAVDPSVQLADFDRVQAYARYHSSLFPVTLYAGMLDLPQDLPPKDVHLLSTACSLVVSEDFHYALVTLFLQTANSIHRAPGPFQTYGEYPSPKNVTLPLMPEAEQFYESGPSFFFRYLPFFWAATFDRLIILLLPLVTLLFPLFRVAPPLYGWILRRKLLKKQEILRDVEINEHGLSHAQRKAVLKELTEQLAELKNLPPNYQNDVFLFQLRLERVQDQLAKASSDEGLEAR